MEQKLPDIPPAGARLWEWFWDIVGGKGGEEGFWVSLKAWSDMTGNKPTMWETDALKQLHNEYQKQIQKKIMEK